MEGQSTHPSFSSCQWQYVWLLKQKDRFLHSLLPDSNATYTLKYCQYTKQSAKQWLQLEGKFCPLFNYIKLN